MTQARLPLPIGQTWQLEKVKTLIPDTSGNRTIFNELLAAGADPDARNNRNETALSLAKKLKRKKMIAILEKLKNRHATDHTERRD